MDPIVIILIVALLAVGAVAAWMYVQKRRTDRLAGQFGPEYRHAVEERGDQRTAESDLEAREKRVRKLDIRGISAEERDRYGSEWRSVQARFVDDPPGAISEADRLVQDVMQTRGYPVGDFEQRAADVSVDHPRVVEHYRAGHAIAERHTGDGASTEDLRQAMVHYRALFDDLLESEAGEQVEARQ